MYGESSVSGSGGNHNVVSYDYSDKKADSGKVLNVTPHFPILKISLNKSYIRVLITKECHIFFFKINLDNNLSNYKNIQLSSGIQIVTSHKYLGLKASINVSNIIIFDITESQHLIKHDT